MLSDQKKILANSRLAVCNSKYVPVMMGCLVLAGVYFNSGADFSHVFFGWAWTLLAIVILIKRKNECKTIKEMTE